MKRKDGTRYRGADMLYTIVPFIMVKRSDACNALTVHLPYNSMHDYIAAKRAQGVNLSYMTLFIAAYVRTVAKYPALNRFIVNKRIYPQLLNRRHGSSARRRRRGHHEQAGF